MPSLMQQRLWSPFRRFVLPAALVTAWLTAGVATAQLTDDDIDALRKQGEEEGWTFTIDRNEATERPLHELCGFIPPTDWDDGPWDPCQTRGDLPDAFDWRDYDGCTPIRNQGGCGSCWAFAAIGTTECAILIETEESVNLSEQWLISCTSAGSCSGGSVSLSYRHLVDHDRTDLCGDSGAVLEEDFRYRAANVACECPYDHPYHLDLWRNIGIGGTPSVSQIKQAIFDHGPVSCGVYANSAFGAYSSGVFNGCGSGACNHAVILVGWDDTMGTAGVWILRNSWGIMWGERGYMYIEYGCSSVGSWAQYVAYVPPPPSGIDHQLIEVPITPEAIADDPVLDGARTFDLQVVMTEDDDWTSTSATIGIDGTLYQHPTFDADTPQSGWWSLFPSLEFDSVFSARDFEAPAFVEGPTVTTDSMSAVWFDTLNTGNGTYTIGRFTVTTGTLLTVTGTSTAAHTFGELHPFSFEVQVDLSPACVGDIDGDGSRGQLDLAILLASYNLPPEDQYYDARADLDGDGDVDQFDLGILLANYDIPCP
ncbi:MAG: hypothetical protein KAS72_08730 [Phycisphaerales bacterium]|nr:hypothetical protein [Phycisphaerales bacterium]